VAVSRLANAKLVTFFDSTKFYPYFLCVF
jgi:hypothetical protein